MFRLESFVHTEHFLQLAQIDLVIYPQRAHNSEFLLLTYVCIRILEGTKNKIYTIYCQGEESILCDYL
jgi:hypothetical protein